MKNDMYTTENFYRPLYYIADIFYDNSLSNIKLTVYQVQGICRHILNFVKHKFNIFEGNTLL